MLLIELAEQYAESAMLIDQRIKEMEAANTAGTRYTDTSTLRLNVLVFSISYVFIIL